MGKVGQPSIVKKALDLLTHALPEKKEIIMTYAQQLRREGKQEGRQEGMQLGRQEGMQLGKQEGMRLGKQEGMQLGKQEGMQLGKQEGMRLGKQEGMQLGKQEGIREIAKNMLKKACSTALIAQVTGLSQEEIHTLK